MTRGMCRQFTREGRRRQQGAGPKSAKFREILAADRPTTGTASPAERTAGAGAGLAVALDALIAGCRFSCSRSWYADSRRSIEIGRSLVRHRPEGMVLAALPCALGGALVLSLRGELPRPRADDGRTRRLGRPLDDFPMGPEVRSGDREEIGRASCRERV